MSRYPTATKKPIVFLTPILSMIRNARIQGGGTATVQPHENQGVSTSSFLENNAIMIVIVRRLQQQVAKTYNSEIKCG